MPEPMERFRDLLAEVMLRNRFYQGKYANSAIKLEEFHVPADLARLPFVAKSELIADHTEHPPYGEILTYSVSSYSRLHQTSGTTSGKALCWLDTPASWSNLLQCWQQGFALMGVSPGDRFFFPFSFGPFLGFWTAFEAAATSGFLCIPGGGMTSTARLRMLIDHEATILCCTPTYALHLAEVAVKEGIDLSRSRVRALIVAGEPGGSIATIREQIEKAWGARVFDHYGMTEVGPVAFETVGKPGALAFLSDHYLAESIDPVSEQPVDDGEIGELVLTNLGRTGSPLIRYRTGDLVRLRPQRDEGGAIVLEGGVLGRTDDMIHLRGNNFYPGSLESVIRRFAEVVEYRIVVDQSGSLADLRVEVETSTDANAEGTAELIAKAIRDELLFRVEVTAVRPGSLPRFEMKARRVVKG